MKVLALVNSTIIRITISTDEGSVCAMLYTITLSRFLSFFFPLPPFQFLKYFIVREREKRTAASRAALPIPISVCIIFLCPNHGIQHGCQCLGFLTSAQMLRHATAHGGCTDTVRESALKVYSARKIPCRTVSWTGLP